MGGGGRKTYRLSTNVEHGYVTIGYVVDGASVVGGGSVVEGCTEEKEEEERGREAEMLLLRGVAALDAVAEGVIPVEMLDSCVVVPAPVIVVPLSLEGNEQACLFSTCRFSNTPSTSSRFTLPAFHSQSIDHCSSPAPSPPSP